MRQDRCGSPRTSPRRHPPRAAGCPCRPSRRGSSPAHCSSVRTASSASRRETFGSCWRHGLSLARSLAVRGARLAVAARARRRSAEKVHHAAVSERLQAPTSVATTKSGRQRPPADAPHVDEGNRQADGGHAAGEEQVRGIVAVLTNACQCRRVWNRRIAERCARR